MKIRTDFVTNSSSENQAEVIIDNLALLEVLQRYKEMGAYGEHDFNFKIGCFGHETWSGQDLKSEIKTPAFHLYEDYRGEGRSLVEHDYIPTVLDDVLSHIISIIEIEISYQKDIDDRLFKQMKQELHEKKDEIKNSYTKVIYFYEYLSDLDGYVHKDIFTFDPENGELYNEEYYEDEDW